MCLSDLPRVDRVELLQIEALDLQRQFVDENSSVGCLCKSHRILEESKCSI